MPSRHSSRNRAGRWALAICVTAALAAGPAPAADEEPEVEILDPPPGAQQDLPPEPSPAASEMLQAMREKGILSEEEYVDLYKRQAIYEHEQRIKDDTPLWARDWTVGGDIRVRLERINTGDLNLGQVIPGGMVGREAVLVQGVDNVNFFNNTASGVRDRWRLRLRVGAERRLGDHFTAGFRIATAMEQVLSTNFGTDVTGVNLDRVVVDYRSSNVTLGNFFEPKGIYLDRAYIRFNPAFAPALNIEIGKFSNPFVSRDWVSDFLIWDQDIQLEGAKLQYRFDFIREQLWADLNFGYFVLDEIGGVTISQLSPDQCDPDTRCATVRLPQQDDRDPFMLGYQVGFHFDPGRWVRMGVRGSYYDYQNLSIQDAAILTDLGNGGDAIRNNPFMSELPEFSEFYQRGRSVGRVQQGVLDLYTTFLPFGERFPITPFAQYTTLLTADSENQGFGLGIDVGSPELLRLSFMWASLDRNSTVSLFTDSDFCEGFTNCVGWYIAAERAITDHVRLRLAYFSSELNQEECAAFVDNGKPGLFCDTASLQGIPDIYEFRNTTLNRSRVQIDLIAEF